MEYYSKHISKLIEELGRLPGIGAKSAGRLAFHIISMPKEQVESLAGAMLEARRKSPVLQDLLHLDGSGTVPDLSQRGAGSQDHHGGGENTERSDSL